jgi:hydrogenase maturation protease
VPEGALVVGLGHPDRGDDAVGSLVAGRLQADALAGVAVRSLPEPAALTDLWEGYDLVVVVDAALAPGAPGDVQTYDISVGPLPAEVAGALSSHGLDLPAVVETARLLDALPRRLVVVAVTATQFRLGEPPDPAVQAAVDVAAERVRALVSRGTTG